MDTIFSLFDTFKNGINESLHLVLNPEKRVHWFYLCTSLILAIYVYLTTKKEGNFLSFVFKKSYWLSKSAFIDYTFIIFNNILKVILFGSFMLYGRYLAYYMTEFLHYLFGFHRMGISHTSTIVAYTICIILFKDFTSYLTHLAFHRIPALWEFHKTHHSATVLNPFTQYRIHPVELIINNFAQNILSFGIVTGIFDYLSRHAITEFEFYGVNVLSFAFLTFGANLRHSHVPLKYFHALEKILISPFQHQIHHSKNPAHYNKNLGAKLAIWDYLFGTLKRSKGVAQLEFGLDEDAQKSFNTFNGNLFSPFRLLLRRLKVILRKTR